MRLCSPQYSDLGEAGIGYILLAGYDLPPLNFDEEELEALHVGLVMVMRTGDVGLQKAVERGAHKITNVSYAAEFLRVDPFGLPSDDPIQGCATLQDASFAQEAPVLRKLWQESET